MALAAMWAEGNPVRLGSSLTGDVLTVPVRPASSGTTPWSVSSARFSASLEMWTRAAQTLACTSLLGDFSKLTISSRPPTTERTFSPTSCGRAATEGRKDGGERNQQVVRQFTSKSTTHFSPFLHRVYRPGAGRPHRTDFIIPFLP